MMDTRVQDYGNVGVVTGCLLEKAQYKNTDISGTYRFTDVWAKRKGKWEHVAGQETLVVQHQHLRLGRVQRAIERFQHVVETPQS